jgi:hypothetical protein
MSSPMPFGGKNMCCICFDGIQGRWWQCPNCGQKWNMCPDCGEREGCLDCAQ